MEKIYSSSTKGPRRECRERLHTMMQSGHDQDDVLYLVDGYRDRIEEWVSHCLMSVKKTLFSKPFLPSVGGPHEPDTRKANLMWRRFGTWSTSCTSTISPRPNATNMVAGRGAAVEASRESDDGRKSDKKCFFCGRRGNTKKMRRLESGPTYERGGGVTKQAGEAASHRDAHST